MTDAGTPPPEPPVSEPRAPLWERLPLVWIVPIVALGSVLFIAGRAWLERGPLIEITFENASGVQPGTTELRYRDVSVGLVEDVTFTEGLGRVLVQVRLDAEVGEFVDDQAQFWVVRPQVTTQGVSGLSTVLSGVYIEGVWDAEPGGSRTRFEGLNDAPLESLGEGGLQIKLRASGRASVTENAPIVYRGVIVGRLGSATVSEDGSSAEASALIFAPHDRLITASTRFWDISGFSFTLGPGGASLDFNSVASLVSGGVTFETLVSGGGPVEPGTVFTVFPDESDARSSIFSNDQRDVFTLRAVFEDNVAGLEVDSLVEFNGLGIGRVTALNGIVDQERFGDGRVRLVVSMAIRPGRLGIEGENGEDAALEFFERRVSEGLRARLTSASLLTGGLKVELVDLPDAEPAALRASETEGYFIPTAPSEVSDVSASAQGVLDRISALPVEEIMAQAISFLQNVNRIVGSEEWRRLPEQVTGLMDDAGALLASDGVQALPARLESVLQTLDETVRELSESGLPEKLSAAVESVNATAEGVSTAIDRVPALIDDVETALERVPALIDEVTGLATDLRELEVEAVLAEVSELVNNAVRIVAEPAIQAIPERVTALLDETAAVIGSEAVQNLPSRIDSLVADLDAFVADLSEAEMAARMGEAVDGVSAAAEGVTAALDGVPGVIDNANRILADEALAALPGTLTALVERADGLIASDEIQRLPGRIDALIADLQATLSQIEDAALTQRLGEAVDAVTQAAQDAGASVEGIPALVEDIEQVTTRLAEVELDAITEDLSQLLESADAILASEDTRALPGTLNGTLTELRAVLAELNAGALAQNLTSTLASTEEAADAVAGAARDLPDLITRTQGVLDTARTTLEGYQANSGLGRDAREALLEVQRAARAFAALARAIQRNPNSLLTGR